MKFRRSSEPQSDPNSFTLSRFATFEEAAQHQRALAAYMGRVSMRVLPTSTSEEVAMAAATLQAENGRDGAQTATSGNDGYKMLLEVVNGHPDHALIQFRAFGEEALHAYFEDFTRQHLAVESAPE